jgi:hypothetical protein
MIELLKKHGMTALTVAFGVATTVLAVTVAAFRDVEQLQAAILFVGGLLVLGGWAVVVPIVSLVILVWLFAGRQPERAPIQPA